METHYSVPADTMPRALFGQQWLIDVGVDVAFPFASWEYDLDGLIRNPYTDECRIGFRYRRVSTGTQSPNNYCKPP